MSNQAINWAYAQPGLKASDKSVLVYLANRANDDWVCWPSEAAIVADTSLNKKTVITALRRLAAADLIVDTGERKGRTKQVIVWQVGPLAPNGPVFGTIWGRERLASDPNPSPNKTVFANEEDQISPESIPKTEHGTFTEPTSKESSAESIALASAHKAKHRQTIIDSGKKKKTTLSELWVPTTNDRSFAEARGLNVDAEAERFRNHHLARASHRASWSAAWHEWCLNAVMFNRLAGASAVQLTSGPTEPPDPNDPYGCNAWASTLPDAEPGTMLDGSKVPSIAGWTAAGVAHDVCLAVGLPTDWRGDLSHIAAWLRAGVEPQEMIDAILSAPPPRVPGSWWRYDRRVRERAKKPT